jgi:hypothetical protein
VRIALTLTILSSGFVPAEILSCASIQTYIFRRISTSTYSMMGRGDKEVTNVGDGLVEEGRK